MLKSVGADDRPSGNPVGKITAGAPSICPSYSPWELPLRVRERWCDRMAIGKHLGPKIITGTIGIPGCQLWSTTEALWEHWLASVGFLGYSNTCQRLHSGRRRRKKRSAGSTCVKAPFPLTLQKFNALWAGFHPSRVIATLKVYFAMRLASGLVMSRHSITMDAQNLLQLPAIWNESDSYLVPMHCISLLLFTWEVVGQYLRHQGHNIKTQVGEIHKLLGGAALGLFSICTNLYNVCQVFWVILFLHWKNQTVA